MSLVNPIKAQTVELAATTQHVKKGKVVFTITWMRDHNVWHGRLQKGNHVDERRIPKCAELPVTTDVAGARTTATWEVTWPASAVTDNTDMEIYAVIRAEYRFIRDNSWTKLAAKTHSQGIDNLFKKGNAYAVVESKCFGDRSAYDGYLRGNSPLAKLKTPRGELVDGKSMGKDGIRQMSSPWLEHAFLQESKASTSPEVRANLRALRSWMCERKRLPLRWLNVYAPPSDRFYLLAGDYAVRCRVESLNTPEEAPNKPDDPGNDAISGPIQSDWADEPYRPMEFFSLDVRTSRKPGISGDFHDFAARFAELCEKDQVDAEVAAKAKAQANFTFITAPPVS